MNIKAMSITLAIAFAVIPFAANATTTVAKNGATITSWSQKTHGLTKNGYPVMRMFSTLSFGTFTGTSIVKKLPAK
jgi:hypothetical protein